MNTHGNAYIFEWIDSLISQILDPQQKDFFIIEEKEIEALSVKIQQENIHLKSQIRNQLFSLNKHSKKQLLISEYYSTLTLLLNQVLRYQKDNHFGHQPKELMVLIQSVLEELLVFIETRYFTLINPEAQVSATCCRAIQEEMKGRMHALTRRMAPEHLKNATFEIVLQKLRGFMEGKLPEFKANYRTVFYKKALLKGLEELQWDKNEPEDFSVLDKLLIFLNFNSKTYIDLLINFIKEKVSENNTPLEKISKLQFYYKAFKQIQPKPGTILNPEYYDLKIIMKNWFDQEIKYLKKTVYMITTQGTNLTESGLQKNLPAKVKQKVVCNLSSDQLALILRAADESKILMARSMSEVFKTIVPHLSTPYKEDLSYQSMRVKTYNIEDRDRQIAIEMLETIIKKIKTF